MCIAVAFLLFAGTAGTLVANCAESDAMADRGQTVYTGSSMGTSSSAKNERNLAKMAMRALSRDATDAAVGRIAQMDEIRSFLRELWPEEQQTQARGRPCKRGAGNEESEVTPAKHIKAFGGTDVSAANEEMTHAKRALYISGGHGTGKTASLTHILKHEKTSLLPARCRIVQISCRHSMATGRIIPQVIHELGLASVLHKQTIKFDYYICSPEADPILLILDDVDAVHLDSRNSLNVLNTIFTWPYLRGSSLALIGVGNALNLTYNVMVSQ